MDKGTIVYVGGFEMPDKNAAAHRVLNNGKALRELGYNVVFLGISHSEPEMVSTCHHGFECWSIPYPRSLRDWCRYLVDITPMKSILAKYDDIKGLIFYNYQSGAMFRCMRLCRKHQWFCWADATEWYVADHGHPWMKVIKNVDTFLRMRFLNKRVDGLIAISEFLRTYYEKFVHTVEIPPLVDLNEGKWNIPREVDENRLTLVYAGSPSAQKERLDRIVEAVEKVSQKQPVKLLVVGITKTQYEVMYQRRCTCKEIEFWGKVDNCRAIAALKQSDYSIMIRDNNWVVRAGFPTKFVESISAGTPVIANPFSNIGDYIDKKNTIVVENDNIIDAIQKACIQKQCPPNDIFDYRLWKESFIALFGQ